MRHLPLVILVATFGLSGCAFDTGKAPDQGPRATPNATGEGADATAEGEGSGSDGSAIDPDGTLIGPDATEPTIVGNPPLATGPWTTTFTTTLQGDGLTLQPLGARRGFTGVLSAPGGALHLEALP